MLGLCGCACGQISLGGTEAGNPDDDRAITGTVLSSDTASSLGKKATSSACAAETVRAINSSEEVATATVDSRCEFSLSVPIKKAYVLSFLRDDTVVGVLHFQHRSGELPTRTMPIHAGRNALALGRIRFSGAIALPETQPATQNDADDDGTADFDDPDDDNDGVSDADEPDCDLDGFEDALDDEPDDCSVADAKAVPIRAVLPHHDASLEREYRFVNLTREVRARFGCDVDTSTVTASTFQVVAVGHVVSCRFGFSDSGRRVVCDHDADPFAASQIYTASIDGVRCADGRSIRARTWSWRTRSQ